MFEQIRAYLEALATPEQTELLMGAIEDLYNAGYTRIDTMLENEMAVQETYNDGLAFQVAENIIRPLYIRAFGEFGILLTDETPLPIMVQLFSALMSVENYDGVEVLLGILNDAEDAEQALAEVVAEVAGGQSEDYLEHIESVSGSLIERMSDQLSIDQPENPEHPHPETRPRAKERYLRFEQIHGRQEWIREEFQGGLVTGLPWRTLVERYAEDVLSLWDDQIEQALLRLCCLSLVSAADDEAVLPNVQDFIDRHHSDTDTLIAITNAVNRLRVADVLTETADNG